MDHTLRGGNAGITGRRGAPGCTLAAGPGCGCRRTDGPGTACPRRRRRSSRIGPLPPCSGFPSVVTPRASCCNSPWRSPPRPPWAPGTTGRRRTPGIGGRTGPAWRAPGRLGPGRLVKGLTLLGVAGRCGPAPGDAPCAFARNSSRTALGLPPPPCGVCPGDPCRGRRCTAAVSVDGVRCCPRSSWGTLPSSRSFRFAFRRFFSNS